MTANTTTIWDVTIVDPLGVDVINYKETGLKLQKTWTPEIGRKLNGEYKVVVNYTQFGTKKTALYKLNVYNYPLIVNNVSVVKRSGAISVEADIASLSKLVQNPMLVVQVTNDKGLVINISTAKIKNLQASQKVQPNTKVKVTLYKDGRSVKTTEVSVNTDNTYSLQTNLTATGYYTFVAQLGTERAEKFIKVVRK